MSDNQTNVDEDLTIDMAWKSDLASVYNDPDGETVDVPGDSNSGNMTTQQHPDIDDWDDLTDKQQEVITTASDPCSNWESLTDLSNSVDAERDCARRTLKQNIPELYEEIKNSSHDFTNPAVRTDRIRRLLSDGNSTSEVAKKLDISKSTVRSHAKGLRENEHTTEPALEYNGSTWVPAEQDKQNTQETRTDDTTANRTDRIRRLLSDGHSVREVAQKMDISKTTVRSHAIGRRENEHTTEPALEYNGSTWVPAEQDKQNTQETRTDDTTANRTETTDTDSDAPQLSDSMSTHKTDITSERIDEIRRQELADDSRGPRNADDLTEQQFKYYLKTSDKHHNPSEPPLTYKRSARQWVRVTSAACVICEEFYESHTWQFCPECGSRLMRWDDE